LVEIWDISFEFWDAGMLENWEIGNLVQYEAELGFREF